MLDRIEKALALGVIGGTLVWALGFFLIIFGADTNTLSVDTGGYVMGVGGGSTIGFMAAWAIRTIIKD